MYFWTIQLPSPFKTNCICIIQFPTIRFGMSNPKQKQKWSSTIHFGSQIEKQNWSSTIRFGTSAPEIEKQKCCVVYSD